MDSLTPRELEVVEAIRDGARSLQAVARALDPPISRRTAEAHVARIVEKRLNGFEPDVPGFWRIVMLVRPINEHGYQEVLSDESQGESTE